MDLGRMLDKCRRDQWSIDDLDWSIPPPALPRDKEEAVVQAFIDMAGIELLAGALFETQREKTADPTLKKIFSSTTTSTTTATTRRAPRSPTSARTSCGWCATRHPRSRTRTSRRAS
jgi:hypothetical protein